MPYDVPQLEKQPSESLLYDMDFKGMQRWSLGETITSVSSLVFTPDDIDNDDLQVGAAAVSERRIQFRVSGGTAGTKYKITAVVTTSENNILEGDGYLFVMDS